MRSKQVSLTDASGLFAFGGEMGARMAAVDWSATALGPVSAWPQSLRTCVRIVLTSRQPMFVWWGDSLINLYNDAYKSIVGGKHPAALGQPATVVWREIWDSVGPRAEASMRGNEGTYDEALLLIMERNGYPEETYYTFSYSPVPNDEGGTGGIICANTDDTQRIIGERRLALLRDLASRTSDARTPEEVCQQAGRSFAASPRDMPFASIYLLDPDRKSFVLASTTGIEPGRPASPRSVPVGDDSVWPFTAVLQSQKFAVIDRIAERFDDLPRGPWPRPPTTAVAFPIGPTGETGRGAVLLLGLNPFRLFDDDYRSFLDLIARQVAASMANAEAYEAEKRRAEALAELDRAKTTFFSNVSHEFRTPLTLMLAPIEDMLANPARIEAEVPVVELLHRNALRLLKLVNTLLDFSRIEAGRLQAVFEPTDLSALTSDIASTFRAAVERAGLELVVDCSAVPEPVFVDHDMWEKIVLNLLSNAFKFTFEGSITVRLRAVGSEVLLDVADTGVGVAEEHVPRLFERFHRVEEARARSHEGSGIGLAMVQELVRMHGGSVRVATRAGAGTTFTVTIPRGSAHLPADRIRGARTLAKAGLGAAPFVEEALRWLPEPKSPTIEMRGGALPLGASAGPALASDPGQRATVLVADDNADMRHYLARLLGERWNVRVFHDGLQALDSARRERPDVIVTDVMMPNLDGFGLLRELRADPATRTLPVILLSARAGESARVEGVEAGADDYMVKPFSARELVARVGAQIELARLRGLAEAERAKLHQLFLDAPASIAMCRGPEHVIDFVNGAWLATLEDGKERNVVGLPLAVAVPEHPESIEIFDRVYRTGAAFAAREVSWRSGSPRLPEEQFFSWVAKPTRDSSGVIDGVMSFGIDVTESVAVRKRLDEQRRIAEGAREDAEAARAEAEAANRAKDEFLAMLGHELRNPLSPMMTALQLMRLRGDTSMQREREVLERQVRHLTRLIEDLLDVSRVTRGKLTLKMDRVQLAEVVAKAVEMTSPLIEQRAQHLTIDIPLRGLLLDADPVRLAQVISNLLNNAAKYTPMHGEISVRAELADGEIVVRVRDSGDGIAPELLPRVFDLFAQGGRTIDRAQGGLGIGLAIVRGLVTLHGGSVTARSEGSGRGSEFEVRLPKAVEDVPSAVRDQAGADQSIAPMPGRRVLVVDDNVDAAHVLAELLSELGCKTELAYDGPSAIEAALRFRPDVALLDIGLPVMDGYELARRLRDEPSLAHMRLVAVTGYGQASDRERALESGFDAHMVKPIDLDDLPGLLAGS